MFSVIKKIEPKLVNELLKKEPALFEQYKHISKACIENIQNAINNNSSIDVDEFRNIMIVCKIKENLREPYQQLILDIVKHSNLIDEALQNFQFTPSGLVDLLQNITQDQITQNINSIINTFKTATPEIIVDALIILAKKQNNITEESVADFQYYQYDFWLKNQNDSIEQHSCFQLIKGLQQQLDWMIKSGQVINFESLKNYLKHFRKSTELTFSDIISQKFTYKEQLILFKMLKEQEIFEKTKLCNYIKHSKDFAYYQLFTKQQIVDTQILKEIEGVLTNKINIFYLLLFYSTFPLNPSWDVAQILRTIITSQWEKYPISSQLDIVGYLFRIEKLTSKPTPQNYIILDSLLISKIEEMILGLRFQDLGQVDRFKVYFILNCYYSKDLLSSHFNTQYALYIQAYLNNQFKTQPRIQSNLQKSVEESLIKQNIKYEREIFVENCFAVDFKIKNTIIEVNGPHHYCHIISDKLPQGIINSWSANLGIYETLKTSLKVIFSTIRHPSYKRKDIKLLMFRILSGRDGVSLINKTKFCMTCFMDQVLKIVSCFIDLFIKMCDAISEKDERYKYASELMDKDGCKKVNSVLNECLKQHKKDWRMCKEQTQNLQLCLAKQQKQ